MIELEFKPDISREEILLASRTRKGEEYPEAVLKEKLSLEMKSRRNKWIAIIIITPVALLLGIGLINMVLQPASYKDMTVSAVIIPGTFYLICATILYSLVVSLESAKKSLAVVDRVASFYSELGFLRPASNSFKSYLMIAPRSMEKTSQQAFADAWKQTLRDISLKVSHQDSVICTHCSKESQGLWSTGHHVIEDNFQPGEKLFVRCPDCSSVYCWKCHIGFSNKQGCPNCDRKLKKGLEIFVIDPDVTGVGIMSELDTDKETESVANVICSIVFTFKGKSLVGGADDVDLGNRGKLVCKFHNKAVKIEDDWRLLAATAGDLTVV